MILDKINKPNDIKEISPADYHILASEIRRFLIEKISKTGGHLSSNLGVVNISLTISSILHPSSSSVIQLTISSNE